MMNDVPRPEVPAEFLSEQPARRFPSRAERRAADETGYRPVTGYLPEGDVSLSPAAAIPVPAAPEDPITPPQRDFIMALLDERELDPKFGLSVEEIRERVATLSKRDASRWITRLRARPPQRSGPGSYPDVPAGRYAVRYAGRDDAAITLREVVKFYRVARPTEGRWAGFTFLSIQASDELHPIKNPDAKRQILADIAKDPAAASRLYGQEIGSCGVCGRTLTDETSRAYGIGPICRERTGW